MRYNPLRVLFVAAAFTLTVAIAVSSALGQSDTDKGQIFFRQNAKKPGVITTASGLQYKILIEGKGKSPKATDRVVVNYRGTLLDGTEFDKFVQAWTTARIYVGTSDRRMDRRTSIDEGGGKVSVFRPVKLSLWAHWRRRARSDPTSR